MTQDDIKHEVATLLTVRRCSYNEIARRLGLTEFRVGDIITDLRRMGPAAHDAPESAHGVPPGSAG